MKLKKLSALFLSAVVAATCLISAFPAGAETKVTLVNAYIRLDSNPVPYDNDVSAYDMKTQAYLAVAEECYSLEGVTDRLLREPSVVIPENTKVLWYEIVNDNGKWRLHGVFVPDEPEQETGEKINMKIITPKKMSVRFEDGSIFASDSELSKIPSVEVEIGKTYAFQMCSNDWETGIYDDNGNGLCGTVVYHVRVSDSYSERSYDEATHTFVLPKGDPVLRTDINSCFMAYRYHFKKGDYNKQTGIANVVDKPLESLSVNLPLGSTVKSDAYKNYSYIDSDNVFIERAEDLSLSYTDYYWNY